MGSSVTIQIFIIHHYLQIIKKLLRAWSHTHSPLALLVIHTLERSCRRPHTAETKSWTKHLHVLFCVAWCQRNHYRESQNRKSLQMIQEPASLSCNCSSISTASQSFSRDFRPCITLLTTHLRLLDFIKILVNLLHKRNF